MIFVTVGTTGFDELVKQIDTLAAEIKEDIIIQIGPGAYLPRNCKYFRYESSLSAYYDRADIVISHGGLATVSEVLRMNKRLVAVEDTQQPDRHQQQILNIWEEKGYLLWCKDIAHIQNCINTAKSTVFVTYEPPLCEIPNVIQQYIDQWQNSDD